MQEHPTLIRFPAMRYVELLLDGKPEDYEVVSYGLGDIARVVKKDTGEVIYSGPGPVTVYVSPAPF